MNAKEKYLENFLSLKKLKEKDSEREREREKRNYLFIYSLTKIKVSLCFTINNQNLCFVLFHKLHLKKTFFHHPLGNFIYKIAFKLQRSQKIPRI